MRNFGLLKVAAATRLRRDAHRDRVRDRGRGWNGDRGQGSIEYVGITILVVAIVVLLLNTNMGATIADTFTSKINSVLNGGG